MRKVNRSLVGVPFSISNLHNDFDRYEKLVSDIRTGGCNRVVGSIYGDDSVKSSLRSLYFNLCFLCQKDIRTRQVVEHFLPYNNFHPERAYDWDNLHLSCDKCNGEKIAKQYKKIDNSVTDEQYHSLGLVPNGRTKKIDDILLLDPARDDVERLISFDFQTNEAIATDITNEKAILTAQLLNKHELPSLRSLMYTSLTQFCESPQYFESWIRLKRIGPSFYQQTLTKTEPEDRNLADFCFRLASVYFAVNKPFNMYLKSVFNSSSHVSTQALKHFARQHCEFEDIPLPALVI